MRATIKRLHNGNVVLSYDSDTGERKIREFSVRDDGYIGYVREWSDLPIGWQQVCERLSHRGNALVATNKTLEYVIRKEYRSMRRRNAKRKQ